MPSIHCISPFFPEIFLILCFDSHIQSHLVMSSVPNLHNRENLNISGREEDIQKRKTPSFFVLKGLFNKLIFLIKSLFFHFIGTLSESRQIFLWRIVTTISVTPGNKKTILCSGLQSYTMTDFWIFPLLTRIECCLAKACLSPAINKC